MDPFDELAGLSASGAPSRQTNQRTLPTVVFQQSSGVSAAASQLTPEMNALPSMARGNPFVDTPSKATAAPARAKTGSNGTFQVLLCILSVCALAPE